MSARNFLPTPIETASSSLKPDTGFTGAGYCPPANPFQTGTRRLLHQPSASLNFLKFQQHALVLAKFSTGGEETGASIALQQGTAVPKLPMCIKGYPELRCLPQLRRLPIFRSQGTHEQVWLIYQLCLQKTCYLMSFLWSADSIL